MHTRTDARTHTHTHTLQQTMQLASKPKNSRLCMWQYTVWYVTRKTCIFRRRPVLVFHADARAAMRGLSTGMYNVEDYLGRMLYCNCKFASRIKQTVTIGELDGLGKNEWQQKWGLMHSHQCSLQINSTRKGALETSPH